MTSVHHDVRRRAATATGLALATTIAVAGCASGTPSGTESSGAPTTTVTFGLQLAPESLDIRNQAGAAIDQVLIDNIYEGLVSRDASGTISPSLAKEWEVSDDALTYTFTLNEGETFSNGDELTSEDVVWSIKDVIDNELRDAEALAKVKDIEATDDTTVVITLTDPDPTLLFNLAGRPGLVLDEEADNDLKTTAIGSGPFLLDEWKQGDSITLAYNPDYWGEKAKVGTVVFQYFSDVNAILNALLDGSIDVGAVDATLKAQIEGNDDYDLVTGFASDKFTLAFNNAQAPFTDKRVRQAIRYAIDHDAIVEAVGSGKTLYGPIVDSDPGYEDLSDLYPYDPDKATQLLADAGYGDGLELTVTIASFYGTTITDLLTSQLAEVGITLKVNAVEFSAWLNDAYTNKDYELSIVDHAEARDFYNWANPEYYFGYDNAEVQDLYAKATSATSEEDYADYLKQAARIVSEDAAADWLLNPTTTLAVRKGLSGVPTDSTSSRLDVTNVSVSE